jgi:hypothetical protein
VNCEHRKPWRPTTTLEPATLGSMKKQRFATQYAVPMFFFLLPALLPLATAVMAQAPIPPATTPGTTSFTRPCSANPVLSGTKNKKMGSHKSKHPLPSERPPACIEARGETVEIQEFLQGLARQQSWRIGENRASDDSWSFVRYLNSDELERFADTKVLIEPVDFTSGKAAVIVRTTDIGEGYARVQISAQIQGAGKSTEKAMAQPGSEWPLNSKGVLEQELVTALQTTYKPLE